MITSSKVSLGSYNGGAVLGAMGDVKTSLSMGL